MIPKKPHVKAYRGITVDVGLDTVVLDILNSNPRVRIIGVCEGHDVPTEIDEHHYGNVPEINLKYKGTISDVLKLKSRSFKVIYSRKYKVFTIRGTKKGTKSWWKEAAKFIRNL